MDQELNQEALDQVAGWRKYQRDLEESEFRSHVEALKDAFVAYADGDETRLEALRGVDPTKPFKIGDRAFDGLGQYRRAYEGAREEAHTQVWMERTQPQREAKYRERVEALERAARNPLNKEVTAAATCNRDCRSPGHKAYDAAFVSAMAAHVAAVENTATFKASKLGWQEWKLQNTPEYRAYIAAAEAFSRANWRPEEWAAEVRKAEEAALQSRLESIARRAASDVERRDSPSGPI